MDKKQVYKVSDELQSIITEYIQFKKIFSRSFRKILEGDIPTQLSIYPRNLLRAYESIKNANVAHQHYIHLILVLFLARKNTIDLDKKEVELILNKDNYCISPDTWKKITSKLSMDEQHLVFKKKTGREIRLFFSTSKDLISLMSELLNTKKYIEPDYDFSLGIFSDKDFFSKELDYYLDFSKFFSDDSPTSKNWISMKDSICKSIKEISEKKQNATVLLKEYKAPSSLALVLGNVVSEYKGLKLLIKRKDDFWRIRKRKFTVNVKDHWIILVKKTKVTDMNEIYISIGVDEPIRSYSMKYWKKENINPLFFVHLVVKPEPHINSVNTNLESNEKIEAIYSFLTKLKNRIAYIKIHLFLSASFAFSIMLGARLSSVSNVQLYEFDQNTGLFIPSLLIVRHYD
ncbi:MAG: SAVED domain-containing protein [Candidatus Hodarchaeales archaeon]